MKSMNLLESIEFNDEQAHAQPILADENNRILRFALKPGQLLKEHRAPSSAVRIIVLEGKGIFKGENEASVTCGANSIIVFEPNELHSVQAMDENLIFVAILQNTQENIPEFKAVGLLYNLNK